MELFLVLSVSMIWEQKAHLPRKQEKGKGREVGAGPKKQNSDNDLRRKVNLLSMVSEFRIA